MLTQKQQRFIEYYDGNGTEAARKAGYAGDDAVLAQVASENLRKPKLKEALHSRNKSCMAEVIANRTNRQEFWSGIMWDTDQDIKDRLKASELLGRSEGDFIDRKDKEDDLTLEDLIIMATNPKD